VSKEGFLDLSEVLGLSGLRGRVRGAAVGHPDRVPAEPTRSWGGDAHVGVWHLRGLRPAAQPHDHRQHAAAFGLPVGFYISRCTFVFSEAPAIL